MRGRWSQTSAWHAPAQELGDPTRVFDGRERADNPAMPAWQRGQPHRREVGMKVAVVAADGLIAPMVASKFNEQGHRAVIASPLTSSSTLTVNELAQTFTGAQTTCRRRPGWPLVRIGVALGAVAGVPGLVQPRRRQIPVRPDLAEDLIVNETMGALLPSGWSVRRASTPMMAVNPPGLISRVAIDCSSRPAARGIET
jgi:hypothetical protein